MTTDRGIDWLAISPTVPVFYVRYKELLEDYLGDVQVVRVHAERSGPRCIFTDHDWRNAAYRWRRPYSWRTERARRLFLDGSSLPIGEAAGQACARLHELGSPSTNLVSGRALRRTRRPALPPSRSPWPTLTPAIISALRSTTPAWIDCADGRAGSTSPISPARNGLCALSICGEGDSSYWRTRKSLGTSSKPSAGNVRRRREVERPGCHTQPRRSLDAASTYVIPAVVVTMLLWLLLWIFKASCGNDPVGTLYDTPDIAGLSRNRGDAGGSDRRSAHSTRTRRWVCAARHSRRRCGAVYYGRA